MDAAIRSTHVSTPASLLENRNVVVERKVVSPGLPPPSVRSSSTSYDVTSSSAARCCASSRVRLGGATGHLSCVVTDNPVHRIQSPTGAVWPPRREEREELFGFQGYDRCEQKQDRLLFRPYVPVC